MFLLYQFPIILISHYIDSHQYKFYEYMLYIKYLNSRQNFTMYHIQEAIEIGKYYMIICKMDEKAIGVQGYKPKSKVLGSEINPQDNSQIFMINRIHQSLDQYQIVNCWTDFVLQDNNRQILITEGKQSKYQKFSIEKVKNGKKDNHVYYNIRSSYKPELALALQGSLRLSQFDSNSISQQFRLQQVNNLTIQNSFILVNSHTQKVVDVPKSSGKSGQRIVTWEKNNRWNQRWRWQKVGQYYLIKSLVNDLCLDIAGQSRDSGAKIVQWPQTGGTNQLWYLQQMGNKRFKIWSYHQPSLCLAIRNQDKQDGAYLQVSYTQNPTMYWRIEGALPK